MSELQGIARFKLHDGRLEESERLFALLGQPSAELSANLADSPVRLFTPFPSR